MAFVTLPHTSMVLSTSHVLAANHGSLSTIYLEPVCFRRFFSTQSCNIELPCIIETTNGRLLSVHALHQDLRTVENAAHECSLFVLPKIYM